MNRKTSPPKTPADRVKNLARVISCYKDNKILMNLSVSSDIFGKSHSESEKFKPDARLEKTIGLATPEV